MAASRVPTPAPIGAVVRALSELGFESPTTLATLLGAMGWAESVSAQLHVTSPSAPPSREGPAQPSAVPRLAEDQRGLPSVLTKLAVPQPEVPEWLVNSEPLPIPRHAAPLFEKPIEPLFPPLVTRAILSRLAATPAARGEVDVSSLVATIARGRPLTTLPRCSVLTLSKGLDLLIDEGRGMEPFASDVSTLIDGLARAVGHHRLNIRTFRSCPSTGVMDIETAAMIRYGPPSARTPVLVVSDLGLSEQRAGRKPNAEADWLNFAGQVRSWGNPLLVLMPCSSSRAPLAIRRNIRLVTWDRRTGARLTDRSRSDETSGHNEDGAIRLARLASIAGRIDPQLVRALRLALAKDLGVEAEADLWFSSWAQTAGITGVVLRSEQQREFQDQLAQASGDVLTRAWEILYRLRTDRPWSDRDLVVGCSWLLAQEETTYWALKGFGERGPEREAAELRIRQILKTLVTAGGSELERDALVWTKTARSRLPPAIMKLEPMRHLLLGAALRGVDTLPSPVLAEAIRAGVATYLVPHDRPNTMSIWFRMVEGGFQASLDALPRAQRIDTLMLKPLPIVVSWFATGTSQQAQIDLNPSREAFVALTSNEVEILLPDSSRFRLSRAHAPLPINIPPPPDVFVARDQALTNALNACLARRSKVVGTKSNEPMHIYISYARADELLKSQLEKALETNQRRTPIELWRSRGLQEKDEWSVQIEKAIARADVILLLITPDYLASAFCNREMEMALPRSRDGSTLVIPIIGQECAWQSTPLRLMQALPRDARPITAHRDGAVRTEVWKNIADELDDMLGALRSRPPARQDGVVGPTIVALTGAGGIGKFTLARKLVHEPAVQERYPDGILWLTEDATGYPLHWLRMYVDALDEPVSLTEQHVVDVQRFRNHFADRQVLFVADQRYSSELLPILTEYAGRGCTILVLAETLDTSLRKPLQSIVLYPSTPDVSHKFSEAFDMPSDVPADLIDFTAGNPLLIRLAAVGARVVEPAYLAECARNIFAGTDPKLSIEQRRAFALFAGLWSTALRMPTPSMPSGPNVGGLTGEQRSVLRHLIDVHAGRTRIEKSNVASTSDLTNLVQLGLLEDLGAEVRLHPLLRPAISEIGDVPIVGQLRRQHIRIFLSSPADVAEERSLARSLIDSLAFEPFLRNQVTLDVVSWENHATAAMPEHLTPQAAINRGLAKPSECDVVIVILWSRLGTPLPLEFRKANGDPYQSGTEWEYEDAVAAAKSSGKPLVLLYRRTENPKITLGAADFEGEREQYREVEKFFRRLRQPDGSLKNAVNTYNTPSEFQTLLRHHLIQLLTPRTQPKALLGETRTASSYRGRIEAFYDNLVTSEAGPMPFGGRHRELEQLDAWLTDSRGPARCLLTGPAGRGKSTLLVRWIGRLESAGFLSTADGGHTSGWQLVFVPVSIRFGTNSLNDFYDALAERLAQVAGETFELPLGASTVYSAEKARDLFGRLVLKKLRVLVVLDGLDELLRGGFDGTIIPHRLPSTIRILVSARSQVADGSSAGWLRRLGWDETGSCVVLDLEKLDVKAISEVLAGMGAPFGALAADRGLITRLAALTDGEPLLLRFYADDLWSKRQGATRITAADLDRMQPHFESQLEQWLHEASVNAGEQISQEDVDAFLAILAFAPGPLEHDDLLALMSRISAASGLPSVQHFLAPLGRFITGDGSPGHGFILSHPKIGEYLRTKYLNIAQRVEQAFADWSCEAIARPDQ